LRFIRFLTTPGADYRNVQGKEKEYWREDSLAIGEQGEFQIGNLKFQKGKDGGWHGSLALSGRTDFLAFVPRHRFRLR
jgi:hypothetical protein